MIALRCLFILFLVLNVARGWALNYDADRREAYIESALASLYGVKVTTLWNSYKYLTTVERNECHSGIDRLKVTCLIEAAKRGCSHLSGAAKSSCLLYSDVILINKLGEDKMISPRERYSIMMEAGDYRGRFIQEITYLYATLATEYGLSKENQCEVNDLRCFGRSINQFCVSYGSRNDLSWQYCVGGLLWFIVTHRTER